MSSDEVDGMTNRATGGAIGDEAGGGLVGSSIGPTAAQGVAADAAAPAEIDLESRLTDDDHLSLRLWLRLLSTTLLIEGEVRARLRQVYGTTLPRFDLMAQLERFPDGLRMSELSKRLMVSQGNITGLTDMLERDGWVVREADPRDRRIFAVKPTALGLTTFRRMAAEHESWIRELLAGLSDRERDTMLKLLSKLKDHLRGVLETGG